MDKDARGVEEALVQPATKVDNFLKIVRVAVERDGCDMNEILSRLYSVQVELKREEIA